MIINICNNPGELGLRAAQLSALIINEAIHLNGTARLVVSTGSSQFETLQALIREDIKWERVEVFHLDEYIGLSQAHNASFRRYLNERFISHVKIMKFHSIDTEGDTDQIIRSLTLEIRKRRVDVGLIGIGVNGHIAFNDPPADFNSRDAYKIVDLDDTCRKQQVDEGWFTTIDEVPLKAISMTPWQILQCKSIISSVPHKVKAESVRNTLISNITPDIPATLLKKHPDFHLYLDNNSASEIIPL